MAGLCAREDFSARSSQLATIYDFTDFTDIISGSIAESVGRKFATTESSGLLTAASEGAIFAGPVGPFHQCSIAVSGPPEAHGRAGPGHWSLAASSDAGKGN